MVEVGGSNPPGPTNFLTLCFYLTLFFQNRGFRRASARGRCRGKIVIDVARNLNTSIRYQAFAYGTCPLKRNDALTPTIHVLLSASKPKVLRPHLYEDNPLRLRTQRSSCSADQKRKTGCALEFGNFEKPEKICIRTCPQIPSHRHGK